MNDGEISCASMRYPDKGPKYLVESDLSLCSPLVKWYARTKGAPSASEAAAQHKPLSPLRRWFPACSSLELTRCEGDNPPSLPSFLWSWTTSAGSLNASSSSHSSAGRKRAEDEIWAEIKGNSGLSCHGQGPSKPSPLQTYQYCCVKWWHVIYSVVLETASAV